MGSIHGQLSKYTGIHCVFQQHPLISHERSSLRHFFIHVTLSGSFAVKFTFLPFHKFKWYISRFVHASRVSHLIYLHFKNKNSFKCKLAERSMQCELCRTYSIQYMQSNNYEYKHILSWGTFNTDVACVVNLTNHFVSI